MGIIAMERRECGGRLGLCVWALALALCLVRSSAVEMLETVPRPIFEADNPAEQAQAELEKVDLDKDGKASLAELQKYMTKHIYDPEDIEGLSEEQILDKSIADGEEYLDHLDLNKDGYLDFHEYEKNYQAQLVEMDEWRAEEELVKTRR